MRCVARGSVIEWKALAGKTRPGKKQIMRQQRERNATPRKPQVSSICIVPVLIVSVSRDFHKVVRAYYVFI